ncbi:LOW QUALITY PROTEIN: 2,5-diketo-D-gluconic acid reductase B-like [Anopheles stephensi]|uniref:LOW QUALITY PROTEIN: 2,5-diketo-D-gluconic acid reductase B-like n=1 Tax=Anopheles stephensi TaxID=30069 RepID=UPI001658AD46|nr:LOW QUALITY PROTEIN: 2,5-diketo-D-gluconic acid reductase B-like [Anopheles stephensi]
MIPTRCIRLSDQKSISLPMLGLGTYKISGTDGKEAIKQAIDVGYRMFDTAVAYGNEAIVGEAIRDALREHSHLTREDFFVISKLCGTQHRFDLVENCCRTSVEKLGLDYIDLYLMHTPVALRCTENSLTKGSVQNSFDDTISPTEAWFGLEQCYQEGICRSIGVSNFNEQQLNTLLQEGSVLPAVNQVECSVGFNQKSLRQFCEHQQVLVMGYSPLGKQKLSFLSNQSVNEIALSVGKTPAQVCLRYLIDGGVVPIVKSSNRSRQQENMDVFDFVLTAQQLKVLDAIAGQERACNMHHLSAAKHFPFTDGA